MIDDFDQPELSLTTVWSFLTRHRRLLLACTLLGACACGTVQLLKERQYTAFASFIPQVKQNQSGLSGLGAEIGLAGFGGIQGVQSSQFFADLVTAPTVLRQVVTARYTLADGWPAPTGLLITVYHGRGATDAERVESAAGKLSDHIVVHVSPKTGLISLLVSAPSPGLAMQIAQRLIACVNTINLRLRQSQADADRQFAEEQVTELAAELHAAQNRLLTFAQNNRDDRRSPRLQLEQARLSDEVSMRQDVYRTMASSYAQNRIEAVRNSPVIAPVDLPLPPVRPDPRGVVKGIVGGMVLGVMLGLLFCAFADGWTRRSRGAC